MDTIDEHDEQRRSEECRQRELSQGEIARDRPKCNRQCQCGGEHEHAARCAACAKHGGNQREKRAREDDRPERGRRAIGQPREEAPEQKRRRRIDERQELVTTCVNAGDAPLGLPDFLRVRIDVGVPRRSGRPIRLEVAQGRPRGRQRARREERDRYCNVRERERPRAIHQPKALVEPGVAIACACDITRSSPSTVARYQTLTRARAPNVIFAARGST